jgi:hypothetical protein
VAAETLNNLGSLSAELGKYTDAERYYREAAQIWSQLSAKTTDDQGRNNMRVQYGLALAGLGKHAEATTILAKVLPESRGISGGTLYQLATAYALASAAAAKDTELSSVKRSELADKSAAQAIKLLLLADARRVFKTPVYAARLKKDKSLQPLRSHNKLKELIRKVEGEQRP